MHKPSTILLISSRQIWPALISVLHFRPSRVVLLHTDHERLSDAPTRRLADFLTRLDVVPDMEVQLHRIPDEDYSGIQKALDELDLGNPPFALGFNAGTKLMAVAAVDWVRRRKQQAFYLEWDDEFQRLDFSLQPPVTLAEKPDPHACDHLSPLDLVACQSGSSMIVGRNEHLSLIDHTILKMTDQEFDAALHRKFSKTPADHLTCRNGTVLVNVQKGDALEYAVVFSALRAGVQSCVRGLKLSIPRQNGGSTIHAELDVVFVFRNRLWVIEVKDRHEVEGARALIKEKIINAWEVGGELGRFAYISRVPPNEDLLAFARSVGTAVIHKGNLRHGIRNLVHGLPQPHLP